MSDPSHDEVLRFVQQNRDPFVTSTDVSEEYPEVSNRTIRKRLKDLAESGKLARRRVGQAWVWYEPDPDVSERDQSELANTRSPSSLSQ